MDQVLILWVLVRVKILFISSPGTDFIDVACPEFINGESGPCFFIHFHSGLYSGPAPKFIHFESRSWFYQASRVRGRILSISSPGPYFIKHIQDRVNVQTL